MASVYDNRFQRQIRKIYQGGNRARGGIINDKIKMSRYNGNRKTSRAKILDFMLNRHNNYVAEGVIGEGHVLSCANFLGAPPLDRDRILDKLNNHTGHPGLTRIMH